MKKRKENNSEKLQKKVEKRRMDKMAKKGEIKKTKVIRGKT